MAAKAKQSSRAGAAKVKHKLKLLDCELLRETAEKTTEVREHTLPSAYHRQTYLRYCSTDTIAKLKTKIENSTFESDPDFVKTLIKNCIDEKVSRNEREVTLEKQKIELAKLQLAQLEKEIELQTAKNKALSLNPAAKVEEKQFETLNKETATHISIREAEDWFRPIDLAKECDIYILSRSGSHKETPITYGYKTPLKIDHKTLNQRLKRTIPNILKRK
ncbi:hypothetical protein TNCV_1611281 [Trichonephila clavipes]|nr:hypothetical protein TNCV_1611281 [Trichonephila clavipes]